ncbi:fungal-specific transcription factor domain-containing protein [Aspergillus insuetus]
MPKLSGLLRYRPRKILPYRRVERLSRDLKRQERPGYTGRLFNPSTRMEQMFYSHPLGVNATPMVFKLDTTMKLGYADHHYSSDALRATSGPPTFSAFIPLPTYIRQVPDSIDVDTLDALAAQGAFSLPPANSQLALLRSFVQYVHTDMPLLDLGPLLDGVVFHDGHQVGLLLFQAIMFAGAIFVDAIYLQLMGFNSRRGALRDMFTRARALYDNGCETNHLEIVQALLLFTLYQGDSRCGPSFWMGTLWATTRNMGLQHDRRIFDSDTGLNSGLRRRLWWSTYTRDRAIALDTRLPMFISNEDHHVAALLLSDFETCHATGKAYQQLGLDETVQGTATKTSLALTFIYKVRLCECIGDILSSQYSVEPSFSGQAMYKPRATGISSLEFQRLECALDGWQQSLPQSLQFPISAISTRGQAQDTVQVQQSTVQMLYFTAVHLLHRPSLCLPLTVNSLDGIFRDISAWKIESASGNIIAIAHGLYLDNLTRCLPDTTVISLLSAAISYAVGTGPQLSLATYPPAVYLQQARNCLASLKDRYEAADRAEAFLDCATKLSPSVDSSSLPQR